MATYAELATIQQQSGFGALQDKIRAACVIKAAAYLDALTPTAAQVAWATSALANPAAAAESVTWYVIASNDSASLAQILGATDAAVQTNVNSAADALTGGGA